MCRIGSKRLTGAGEAEALGYEVCSCQEQWVMMSYLFCVINSNLKVNLMADITKMGNCMTGNGSHTVSGLVQLKRQFWFITTWVFIVMVLDIIFISYGYCIHHINCYNN